MTMLGSARGGIHLMRAGDGGTREQHGRPRPGREAVVRT
jgi:hypothetical protein